MSKKPNPLSVDTSLRWAWHLRTLTRLRSRLVRELKEHLQETYSSNATENSDFAERASEESELEIIFAELSAEKDQLAEVEAAIERIKKGSYGVCQATGKPIEEVRLRALPWTRYCHAAAIELAQRSQETK